MEVDIKVNKNDMFFSFIADIWYIKKNCKLSAEKSQNSVNLQNVLKFNQIVGSRIEDKFQIQYEYVNAVVHA